MTRTRATVAALVIAVMHLTAACRHSPMPDATTVPITIEIRQ